MEPKEPDMIRCVNRKTFSILRGSLANGTRCLAPLRSGSFFTFSILRGSLANGTWLGLPVSPDESLFQYPPRIVSQWNSGTGSGTYSHGLFQYPPRIVSQWNFVSMILLPAPMATFSILRGSLANGTSCQQAANSTNTQLSVSSADR